MEAFIYIFAVLTEISTKETIKIPAKDYFLLNEATMGLIVFTLWIITAITIIYFINSSFIF